MYSLTVVLSTWWASLLLAEDEADGPPRILVRAASAYGWPWLASWPSRWASRRPLCTATNCGPPWLSPCPAWLCAVTAVWLRREWWAFTSALGVNLGRFACGLARPAAATPFEDWWLLLVQANVIASAVVALVWLSARSGLKHLRGSGRRLVGPLLSTQILMAATGNAILLALPHGAFDPSARIAAAMDASAVRPGRLDGLVA